MKKLLSVICLVCAANVSFAETPIVKIDGSSTVFPITEAVAEEFQTLKKNKVHVTVGISGTGGGFKKFCRGEIDIQDASRPITTTEMAACKAAGIRYIELPVAYDATVVAVNISNKFVNEISVEDLKKMWEPAAQGKITKWNQINPAWPAENIKLYGAGADSGTFDYFTEAVVGKAKSSRGDYTASEDDNTLVTGISTDKFSIGYLPLAYFEGNKKKLKALLIKSNASAKAVGASIQTVEDGTYKPLSRPVFIYVAEKSLARPEIKEFVEFYLKEAINLVPSVNYVVLPKQVYEQALSNLHKKKFGTVFGGHSEIGLKIQDIMKYEGKL